MKRGCALKWRASGSSELEELDTPLEELGASEELDAITLEELCTAEELDCTTAELDDIMPNELDDTEELEAIMLEELCIAEELEAIALEELCATEELEFAELEESLISSYFAVIFKSPVTVIVSPGIPSLLPSPSYQPTNS